MRGMRWMGVGLAATVLTAGCSGGSTSSSTPGASAGSAQNQLTVWTPGTPGGGSAIQKALADFTKQTGIKVKYQAYSTDPYKQALNNAAGTKAMPDVFQYWTGIGLSQRLLDTNAVAPLDQYYTQYGWQSRLVPGGVKLATFNGKKMAVPWNIHGMAVVYRKDLFARAGIGSVPTTYDELTADNVKLKAAGITPMSLAGKYSWDTMRLLDSLYETKCGAATFDKLRNLQQPWNSTPCTTQGAQELQRWVKQGWVPKDYLGLDPNANQQWTSVVAGKAAMLIEGDWSVPFLTQAKQNLNQYDFFPFPTGTNRLAYFTESLWMSSSSSNKAGAAKLINFLVSRQVQQRYLGEFNTAVPPVTDVPPAKAAPALAKKWVTTISTYKDVFEPSDQAFPPDIAAAYLRHQDQVVLGSESPAQTVANFTSDITRLKKK